MVGAKEGGEGGDYVDAHQRVIETLDYRVRDVGSSAQVDELATLVERQLLARRDGLDDLPRPAHLCSQPGICDRDRVMRRKLGQAEYRLKSL